MSNRIWKGGWKKPSKWAFTIVFSTLTYLAAWSQPLKKFSGQNYSVNEGLLESHVIDMVEDNRGFLWLSTAEGLQRFDGIDFKSIPSQNKDLPETGYIHFLKLKNGTIWMSFGHGISAYNSTTDKFKVAFQFPESLTPQKQVQYGSIVINYLIPLGEYEGNVWCWWSKKNKLFSINERSHKVMGDIPLPSAVSGLDTLMDVDQYQISGEKLFLSFKRDRILEIDLGGEHAIRSFSFPGNFHFFYSFCLLDTVHLLVASPYGLFKVDEATGSFRFLNKFPANPLQVNYQTIFHLHDSVFVATLNNEIYLINGENGHFLHHVVTLQNQTFGQTGYITRIMLDQFNNLWTVSLTEGITKINFNDLGIKYFGVPDPKENFIRCIYPDKKANLIIAGTLYKGIMLFDTMQHLIKLRRVPEEFRKSLVSSILKIRPHEYLLLAGGRYSTYILNGTDLSISPAGNYLQKTIDPSYVNYYSNIQPLSDTTAILSSLNTILRITCGEGRITARPIFKGPFSTCGILDRQGKLWLGGNGVYFLVQGPLYNQITLFQLHQSILSKCLFQDKAGNIWLGTENGLYELDSGTGQILRVYNKNNGLADNCIYSLLEDNDGNIWCGTNRGISCVRANGQVVNIYSSDGLQASEFNNNSCAKAADGELYFGGVNGINSFYPTILTGLTDSPQAVITNIKVMDADWSGDTSAWDLHQIKLPYTENVLSFTFSGIGRFRQDVYNYQYRMSGLDKNWVYSGNYGYARYVLTPGHYVFQYAASHNPETPVNNFRQIIVIITPPIWKENWFIFLEFLFLAGLLGLLVYSYVRWNYQRQLRKLEIKQTLQRERERISRDLHDNIGAYTTALIANVDHLKKTSEIPVSSQRLQMVSENAREILGFLQETIWVLNKDVITITDFTDRFKVFAKRIGQNFPETEIHFKDEVGMDAKLSPTEAIHLFRILQEALQNAFKHSHSTKVYILVKCLGSPYFSVRDNGRGFETTVSGHGNGLKNMQFRAREAGYHLNIISDANGSEISLAKDK